MEELIKYSNEGDLDQPEIQPKEETLCQICQKAPKAYKCPRCSLFTCSLECCKEHKKRFNCNGIRDKTTFLSIKEYGESNLRSDYHFLEDVLHSRQSANRRYRLDCAGNFKDSDKKLKKSVNIPLLGKSYQPLDKYSKAVKSLFNSARERGTTVMLLPPGMSRRNENDSFFDFAAKAIMWRISVVFIVKQTFSSVDLINFDPLASLKSLKDVYNAPFIGFTLSKINESTTLSDIMKLALEKSKQYPDFKQILKPFKDNTNELYGSLRIIPSPANNPLFNKFGLNYKLEDILKGQTVIEFPTLYICYEEAFQNLRMLVSESPEEQVSAEEIFIEKKRKRTSFELPSDQDASKQKIHRISGESDVEESDQESDDSEEEEEAEYGDFMKDLLELQNTDIETLKSICASEFVEPDN